VEWHWTCELEAFYSHFCKEAAPPWPGAAQSEREG
jgi:hypothetical protein